MRVEEPSDLVQSVSRALRLLEVVGRAPDGLSAKKIARRCRLNLSTTYHLLRTLCYEGYLVRRPSGDYMLGLEIADRFRDLVAALTQPPAVGTVLRQISSGTGHSVYLARFVNSRVTITQVSEAPGSPHLEDLVVGFDEAAHATALGKALLSTMAAPERRGYLESEGMRPFTARTVREPAQLDAELAGGAGQGFFVEEGQYRRDVSCAATLVRSGDLDDPWWAIALSAESGRFRRTQPDLVGQLRAAASGLESVGARLAVD